MDHSPRHETTDRHRAVLEDLARAPSSGDPTAFANAIVERLRDERLLWPFQTTPGHETAGTVPAVRLIHDVSRISGSAGLIVAMHMSQALTLTRHAGRSPYLSALLQRSIDRQSLVASGTSEKGIGGDILKSLCTLDRKGDGRCSVEKESPNISFLDVADVVLATAQSVTETGAKRQVLIALTRDQIDADPGPTASLLGMRGIVNRPYRLRAEFPEDAIFGEDYPLIARVTMTPSVHLFWSALWSGLAARALATARTAVKNETRGGADTAVAKANELSRLTNKHYVMNALIRDAIGALTGTPASSFDLLAATRVKRLKVVCSELTDEICQGALGLIGLPGYAERGSLSVAEAVRDALSAQILISNYRLVTANTEVERFVEERI